MMNIQLDKKSYTGILLENPTHFNRGPEVNYRKVKFYLILNFNDSYLSSEEFMWEKKGAGPHYKCQKHIGFKPHFLTLEQCGYECQCHKSYSNVIVNL